MVMLVTAAELATSIKQPVKTASAELAISTASAYVESVTGMAFTERTAVIQVTAPNGQYLDIPLKPIRGITSAVVSGNSYTDYLITATGLYRQLGWRSKSTPEAVTLTVEYGISVTPPDVKGLVLEVAGFLYDERAGIQSEGVDDYRVTYTGRLSPMSLSTLSNYGVNVATWAMNA